MSIHSPSDKPIFNKATEKTLTTCKLATWNINSVRLRIDQVIAFLNTHQPDILGLQETKCLPEQFPYQPFIEAGYEFIEVSGQKGYHGAATVSKLPLERLETDFCPIGEARHVSTRVKIGIASDNEMGAGTFEFHNFYVPAGGDEADVTLNPKFKHKLEFLKNMTDYFTDRAKGDDARHVLVGDFNIAPGEHDVWSHKQLLKVVSHTPLEVGVLKGLQDSHNFTDTSRLHRSEEEKLYSWWSYRAKDVFKSNRGRRLDHIWVSPALRQSAIAAGIDGFEIHTNCRIWERPSDHAPITQILKF